MRRRGRRLISVTAARRGFIGAPRPYAMVAGALALCTALAAQSAAVPQKSGAQEQRNGDAGSGVVAASPPAPSFKKAALQRANRKRGRIRLLIFTRASHATDGVRLIVFSNDSGRQTEAIERPKCGCTGRWVVSPKTRRNRLFLRALGREMRTNGVSRFGAQLRSVGGGPGAGFVIRDYGRRYRPTQVTD